MRRAKLTVRYHDDVYTVDYWPGFAGTYWDAPESPELEVIAINGHPDTAAIDNLPEAEFESLHEALLKLVEDQLAAEEESAHEARAELGSWYEEDTH